MLIFFIKIRWSGDTLSYNGEVVTLMTESKTTLTVSMSTRILEDPTRILVFLEVLHKTVGHIDIDSQGNYSWLKGLYNIDVILSDLPFIKSHV